MHTQQKVPGLAGGQLSAGGGGGQESWCVPMCMYMCACALLRTRACVLMCVRMYLCLSVLVSMCVGSIYAYGFLCVQYAFISLCWCESVCTCLYLFVLCVYL